VMEIVHETGDDLDFVTDAMKALLQTQ